MSAAAIAQYDAATYRAELAEIIRDRARTLTAAEVGALISDAETTAARATAARMAAKAGEIPEPIGGMPRRPDNRRLRWAPGVIAAWLETGEAVAA